MDRDQDAAVEAGTAGVEPLQPVDGRKADHGIVEGQKLPVQGGPGRVCALLRKTIWGWGIGYVSRHARLCGRVGGRIVGPKGEDVFLWPLNPG